MRSEKIVRLSVPSSLRPRHMLTISKPSALLLLSDVCLFLWLPSKALTFLLESYCQDILPIPDLGCRSRENTATNSRNAQTSPNGGGRGRVRSALPLFGSIIELISITVTTFLWKNKPWSCRSIVLSRLVNTQSPCTGS